jgi:xylulokinase
MTTRTDRTALAQAVLEGVAFGLRDGLDALRAAGCEIARISVIGGGSRSNYWGQILSNVLGVPLDYREGSTVGPAIGAARLARLAVTREPIDAVCQPPPVVQQIEPNAALSAHYDTRAVRFRALYQTLKSSFEGDPTC